MSVLVCGGSRGIGRAIAVGLANPGTQVFINYSRAHHEAREAAAAVERAGAVASLVPGDISSIAGAADVMTRVGDLTEHIDVLVHCAVKTVPGAVLQADPAEFLQAVQVNAMSLLYIVQAGLPLLGTGSSVIYLSSRGSRMALKDYASVGAPKAFAESLIRYMAVELAPLGARANCVSPTAQDTNAFRAVFREDYRERLQAAASRSPSGRAVSLDDIVNAVRFLASSASEMVQGQVLILDGGTSLVG